MLEDWIKTLDMNVYGGRYILLRELFYEYVYYCKKNGISDICTDRSFSKQLQSLGYLMKYTMNGAAFNLSQERDWEEIA